MEQHIAGQAPVSNPVGAISGGSEAASQASISQTLTNSTDNPATLTYNVQPEFNECKGDSFVVTITVNPTIETDPIDDQVLCNGDDTEDVSFSSTNFNEEDSESLVGEFTHTITFSGVTNF